MDRRLGRWLGHPRGQDNQRGVVDHRPPFVYPPLIEVVDEAAVTELLGTAAAPPLGVRAPALMMAVHGLLGPDKPPTICTA